METTGRLKEERSVVSIVGRKVKVVPVVEMEGCNGPLDNMVNPATQIDLPLEEMMEVQRAEATCQVEEVRPAEIARRDEANNFATALAERN
ncbi:hypothetical protein HAX54_032662 [Datura stramonium]|uniref:Uncharacterized protein n=1 Tax=Datura stramonium TaxID=4076 RepID=A0ABS8VBP3_DATST|nr:hypothetical protein [Datura stramonium]